MSSTRQTCRRSCQSNSTSEQQRPENIAIDGVAQRSAIRRGGPKSKAPAPEHQRSRGRRHLLAKGGYPCMFRDRRENRTEEVIGSIPFSSTNQNQLTSALHAKAANNTCQLQVPLIPLCKPLYHRGLGTIEERRLDPTVFPSSNDHFLATPCHANRISPRSEEPLIRYPRMTTTRNWSQKGRDG